MTETCMRFENNFTSFWTFSPLFFLPLDASWCAISTSLPAPLHYSSHYDKAGKLTRLFPCTFLYFPLYCLQLRPRKMVDLILYEHYKPPSHPAYLLSSQPDIRRRNKGACSCSLMEPGLSLRLAKPRPFPRALSQLSKQLWRRGLFDRWWAINHHHPPPHHPPTFGFPSLFTKNFPPDRLIDAGVPSRASEIRLQLHPIPWRSWTLNLFVFLRASGVVLPRLSD